MGSSNEPPATAASEVSRDGGVIGVGADAKRLEARLAAAGQRLGAIGYRPRALRR